MTVKLHGIYQSVKKTCNSYFSFLKIACQNIRYDQCYTMRLDLELLGQVESETGGPAIFFVADLDSLNPYPERGFCLGELSVSVLELAP